MNSPMMEINNHINNDLIVNYETEEVQTVEGT